MDDLRSPRAIARSRYIAAAASAYVLAGGLLSFLGWATDTYRLTDWTNSGIAMKANTAVCAALTSTAVLLIALSPSQRHWLRAFVLLLAGSSALIGVLTLFEHLTGLSLGIDTLLFDEPPGAPATSAPGRMGPPAATSFLFIGMAAVLAGFGPRARGWAVALSLAVLCLGILSLTGYAYRAQVMYALPRLTGIALQTASMVTALGIAMVAAMPDRQPVRTLCEDTNAGVLARRLLPLVVLVPLALGWMRLQGQRVGLYDLAFGTAIRTVSEVLLLAVLLWWVLGAVRAREIKQMQAEEALKEADRRKDEFLATLAHELRNPLAPIRQAAEIVRSPAATTAQLQWSRDVIARQVRNMARLLDELLDISRITRGSLEVRKVPVALGSVVDAALEVVRPTVESRGHTLVVDVPDRDVELNVDPLRIAQVLANLLTNAAKYSNDNGHIQLSAHLQPHEVVFTVSDRGIGIEPHLLPEIFGMFVQLKSPLDRSEGGLGIGLALASGFVELHGGSIEARSGGPGQGSEFIVRLPR